MSNEHVSAYSNESSRRMNPLTVLHVHWDFTDKGADKLALEMNLLDMESIDSHFLVYLQKRESRGVLNPVHKHFAVFS